MIQIGITLGVCGGTPSGGSSPPAYTPSLDFSDARNSMYL